ncbi:MAG TPA: DOPA 4,5-dioxygenase family protein [Dongiaceae bacterium]|jgi:DOPA 4,5-dioxygenase|nr:DOPA 4,5-dioxygenase family protein [Dongiaceae bacterium]
MTADNREPLPLSEITSYHAHIYYDPGEGRERAAHLRTLIGERFVVRLGSWHDKPVGPHPKSMYQVAFAAELFPRIVPWLMLNRMGLSILVHPNTRRPRDDHLIHALWLGEALPLKGEILPVEVGADKIEELSPPNTSPTLDP